MTPQSLLSTQVPHSVPAVLQEYREGKSSRRVGGINHLIVSLSRDGAIVTTSGGSLMSTSSGSKQLTSSIVVLPSLGHAKSPSPPGDRASESRTISKVISWFPSMTSGAADCSRPTSNLANLTRPIGSPDLQWVAANWNLSRPSSHLLQPFTRAGIVAGKGLFLK